MAISSSSVASLVMFLAFTVMAFQPCSFTARSGTMVGARMEIPNVQSDPDVQDLGRYCVEEHNKRENCDVSFVHVVEGQKQVVAGIKYYLRIEAVDAGVPKQFDATVVVKAWLPSKELLSFSEST